jgi:ATP-dependent Zn protease
VWQFLGGGHKETRRPFSAFIETVENSASDIVKDPPVEIRADGGFAEFRWRTKKAPSEEVLVSTGAIDQNVFEKLNKAHVSYEIVKQSNGLWQTTISWLPVLLVAVVVLFIFLMLLRQSHAGVAPALSFGKSRAKRVEQKPSITFGSVEGAEEAKEALHEVVQFLRNPGVFTKMGARMRSGVLLIGPPGTGKTLLARAVAGEAGVPFYSITGSEFTEMFVGVGASRVRDMFAEGKKNAPCVIFIDEIDAVGRHRGAGLGGGHDEREQTLNQLLSELDGFDDQTGIIVIAATNRFDVLDRALLRPGRFDRKIFVGPPNRKTREGLLKLYTKKTTLAADVNVSRLAMWSAGLTGADIESMVNEAAILAARRDRDRIVHVDFDDALRRIGHRVPGATSVDDLERALTGKVFGQSRAVRAIAHAVSMHYNDLRASQEALDRRFRWKPNVLLYGPTGSGKSWIVECVAKELDVPTTTIDVATLAMDSGSFRIALRRLLDAADNNERRATMGIVSITGLERLLTPNAVTVQEELARIIDGLRFDISVSDVYADRSTQSMHTGPILFVAEATVIPDEPSTSEQLKEGAIAPHPRNSRLHRYSMLRRVGLLPSLLDAFSVIEPTQGLSAEDLRKIIEGPRPPANANEVMDALMKGVQTQFQVRLPQVRKPPMLDKDGYAALERYLAPLAESSRFKAALVDEVVNHYLMAPTARQALTAAMIDAAAQAMAPPPATEHYRRRFEEVGIALTFEEQAIESIAKHASAQARNARGLAAILDEIIAAHSDALVPPQAVITEAMVEEVVTGGRLRPEHARGIA